MLWWALQDRRTLALLVLAGATLVLLVAQVVRLELPPRRRRQGVLTQRLAMRGGLGALIGFCVLPVVGAAPGFVAGIYLAERARLGRHGEAMTATRTVLRSGGWRLFTEFFAGLLIMAAWLGALSA
jgi:uncharacterized protein